MRGARLVSLVLVSACAVPRTPAPPEGAPLDRTEVTVAAYARCIDAGSCTEPDAFLDEKGSYRAFCNWKHPEGRASHPVNCVDFEQARAFCGWAGEHLPTEEEWERVAKGGEERIYPWGDAMPDETRLNACGAECPENAARKGFLGWPAMYAGSDGWAETAPVGSFPAGAAKDGTLDLAGNVWEWTSSTFDGTDKRVLRGGSFGAGDPKTVRIDYRFRLAPSARSQFLGFRCAKGASRLP
jgi:formylglycine-generating enzyme required for sulfatase activity